MECSTVVNVVQSVGGAQRVCLGMSSVNIRCIVRAYVGQASIVDASATPVVVVHITVMMLFVIYLHTYVRA